MKKLHLFLILLVTLSISKGQTEVVYKSDSLKVGNQFEKKSCKIVLKYDANEKLTQVTIKYVNKKLKDWVFEIVKPMNYFWNCEEYHATSGGMNVMVGICSEEKKGKSFIVCTDSGAMNNDCMKYLLKK